MRRKKRRDNGRGRNKEKTERGGKVKRKRR